jgi:hypothetical protein
MWLVCFDVQKHLAGENYAQMYGMLEVVCSNAMTGFVVNVF